MLACSGFQPSPCNARTDANLAPDPWLVPISSITGNSGSGTVNVTTANPHGLLTGQHVNISGVFDFNNRTNTQLANTDFNTFGFGTPNPTLAAPTVTTTGGTIGAGTFCFVITYAGSFTGGETAASNEQCVTTTGSTNQITITSPAAWVNVTSYNIYEGAKLTPIGSTEKLATVSGSICTVSGGGCAIGSNAVFASSISAAGATVPTNNPTYPGPAITVDSPTTFHFPWTVNSASVMDTGYVVTQTVPNVGIMFVDPTTGERGVRVTCQDSNTLAGYEHSWCGPDPLIWKGHSATVNFQEWNTNTATANGEIGVYCPPSGSLVIGGQNYSCWHPGKYNFYINQVGGTGLHGGGVELGYFDPITLQDSIVPIGYPSLGTYKSPSASGNLWWSKTNPDVLFYSSSSSGSTAAGIYKLNVKDNNGGAGPTLALDPTNCGVPITAANLLSESVQTFVSDDDRYLDWVGGGLYAGTPNQKDFQNGWIYHLLLDTQASPHPLCYAWNTATGMAQTWDTVSHTVVSGPTQVVDTAFAGNPPAAETTPPPAPTVTPTSGGNLPSGTYFVKVTYVNWANASIYATYSGSDTGLPMESAPSLEVSVTLSGTNHSFSVSPPSTPTNTYPANYNVVWPQAYNVYASSTSGSEVSQTPMAQGPNTPSATATTGGSIAAGNYLVEWSYVTTTGGASNTGGESNASTVPACVTISGSNNAVSIAEPAALAGGAKEESGWNAYVATNSATCPTVSAGTYHIVAGGPFALGSGAELLTSIPTGSQPIGITGNTTGALPLGGSVGIPTGTTFATPASWTALLAGTASPPSTGAAGFTMHGGSMNLVAPGAAASAIWLKASGTQDSMSPGGNPQQQFDVFWNVGSNVAHLCGDEYGPDGTTDFPCGGHPSSGYSHFAGNTNTLVETYQFFSKQFTSLGTGIDIDGPPPVSPPFTSYVDMHQAWEANYLDDSGPMCFTPSDTHGDIPPSSGNLTVNGTSVTLTTGTADPTWVGQQINFNSTSFTVTGLLSKTAITIASPPPNGTYAYNFYGSAWTLALRRAWDNEFVCLSPTGDQRSWRYVKFHGSSYGSLINGWTAQPYGVAIIDNCEPSYDGKFAICGCDWYGTIPGINGQVPAGNPTPNAPGEDIFIYELK